MKSLLIIISIICFSLRGNSQKKDNQIELNTFIRLENYPGYTYHYAGRFSNDYIKIKGKNSGVNIGFNYNLKKDIFFKLGIGYFKQSFNKIENTNSLFGKSLPYRPINYFNPLLIEYSTDAYHYNNISINIGFDKRFVFDKTLEIGTSINFSGYFNFSEHYHLTINPFDNNLNFNKTESNFSGLSSNISVGIYKRFVRFTIGPSVILPIYDSWRKDPIFLEENYNGGKNKWLNGIGLGFSAKISLKQKIEK